MRPETNPMAQLYQETFGMDSFSLDGVTTMVASSWQEAPNLRKSL